MFYVPLDANTVYDYGTCLHTSTQYQVLADTPAVCSVVDSNFVLRIRYVRMRVELLQCPVAGSSRVLVYEDRASVTLREAE